MEQNMTNMTDNSYVKIRDQQTPNKDNSIDIMMYYMKHTQNKLFKKLKERQVNKTEKLDIPPQFTSVENYLISRNNNNQPP